MPIRYDTIQGYSVNVMTMLLHLRPDNLDGTFEPITSGPEILKRPPDVCLSVSPSCFVFALTRRRIAVFPRNFAGMCTISWGCALILMGCCLFF